MGDLIPFKRPDIPDSNFFVEPLQPNPSIQPNPTRAEVLMSIVDQALAEGVQDPQVEARFKNFSHFLGEITTGGNPPDILDGDF